MGGFVVFVVIALIVGFVVLFWAVGVMLIGAILAPVVLLFVEAFKSFFQMFQRKA